MWIIRRIENAKVSAIEIIPVLGRQPSTAMRLPMAVPYGVIAFGFALAALRVVLARLPGARRE